jgi:hypothetical protein
MKAINPHPKLIRANLGINRLRDVCLLSSVGKISIIAMYKKDPAAMETKIDEINTALSPVAANIPAMMPKFNNKVSVQVTKK